MREVDPAHVIGRFVVILVQVVAGQRMSGNPASSKDDVVASLEEPEARVRICDDWKARVLQHAPHRRALEARHPEFPWSADRRVGTAGHLDFHFRHHPRERKHRVSDVPSCAEYALLLARRRHDQDRPLWCRRFRQRTGDLEHRRDSWRVIIGTIVDGIAIDRRSCSESVVVRGECDDFIAKCRIVSGNDSDDVVTDPARDFRNGVEGANAVEQLEAWSLARRRDRSEGHLLQVGAVVAARLEPE